MRSYISKLTQPENDGQWEFWSHLCPSSAPPHSRITTLHSSWCSLPWFVYVNISNCDNCLVFHCMHVSQFISPVSYSWTFRLFPDFHYNAAMNSFVHCITSWVCELSPSVVGRIMISEMCPGSNAQDLLLHYCDMAGEVLEVNPLTVRDDPRLPRWGPSINRIRGTLNAEEGGRRVRVGAMLGEKDPTSAGHCGFEDGRGPGARDCA